MKSWVLTPYKGMKTENRRIPTTPAATRQIPFRKHWSADQWRNLVMFVWEGGGVFDIFVHG